MDEATSLLFDLDGFQVVSVVEVDGGYREARVEGVTGEQACPDCGVFSARVHSRTVQRVKDLPYGRPLVVRWHKRRWACAEPACRRRTFSEHNAQVGPGRRLTLRLRERLERAVSGSLRSAADVAREYDVSWWSVNQALVVKAAEVLGPAPPGVVRLGIDETRVRRVRWLLEEAGWRRCDPMLLWVSSGVRSRLIRLIIIGFGCEGIDDEGEEFPDDVALQAADDLSFVQPLLSLRLSPGASAGELRHDQLGGLGGFFAHLGDDVS